MPNHKPLLLLLISLTLLLSTPLKVGFIISGPISDLGYNYQIYQSLLELQSAFPTQITTAYTENIFNVPSCIAAATVFMNSGFDVIFFPSTPFVPCAQNISLTYPSKFFITQNAGEVYPTIPNLAGIVNNGLTEARFILGAFSAKQGANKVCFMAPKFYQSIRRWANLILLGLTHIDPNFAGEVHVGMTGNFDDAPTETIVVNHFLAYGCDIIMQHQNSILSQQLVANGSRWGVGWGSDMRMFAGESVLTSIIFDWEVSFSYYVEKILGGTFTNELFTNDLTNGGIILADFSSEALSSAKQAAKRYKRKVLDGSINPLCGDLIFQKFGTECVAESQLFPVYLDGITVFDGTV